MTKYIFVILFIMWLASLPLNAYATHISEPILNESKTEYYLGEKIVLHGWVSYDNQPTADVLLAFKITHTDGTSVADVSYPSDSKGKFKFEFDTQNLTPGKYRVTVTSHCLEIHRPICTYKSQTLSINITK